MLPDEAVAEIARQAPYAAALLVLSVGYGFMLWKFIESANKRMDQTEVRHTNDRQTQEDRWMSRVQDISVDCHSAQDRASIAIERMSTSAHETSIAVVSLNTKLDTIVDLARKASG